MTMNVTRYGPIPVSGKACTEDRIPLLVRNVPNIVNKNPDIASSMLHILNVPRRRCIERECSKAVATSQGIRAAFSTGSHAQ